MQGIYNLYSDGIMIGSYKNVITKEGKSRIRQMIAGNVSSFASSIVVGVGESVAIEDDTSLDFIVDTTDILATMVDDINNRVYFKASLPTRNEYTIYELGCYATPAGSTGGSTQNSMMINFVDSTDWIDINGSSITSDLKTRIGLNSRYYEIPASTTVKGKSPFFANLSNLEPSAIFSFAYYATNLNSIKLRLKNTDSDYWEATGWNIVNNDYNISKFTKNSFVANGIATWDNITAIEVEITSTASPGVIHLDAIRYDSTGGNNLLSRSLVSDPQLKLAGSTLDIEYVLEGIA